LDVPSTGSRNPSARLPSKASRSEDLALPPGSVPAVAHGDVVDAKPAHGRLGAVEFGVEDGVIGQDAFGETMVGRRHHPMRGQGNDIGSKVEIGGLQARFYDAWNVNEDAEYHEADSAGTQQALQALRLVPRRIGAR
jgi:hypothetical protein